MLTKSCLGLLASAALTANGALAADHRHAARHQHLHAKKEYVPETTTTETAITWTTVYVDGSGDLVSGSEPTTAVEAVPVPVATSSSSSTSVASSSSASVAAPVVPSSSSYVAPTTLVTSTSSAAPVVAATTADPVETAEPEVAVAQVSTSSTSTSAAAAATTAASTSSSSTSGGLATKRGAAYNNVDLVSELLGTGSKIGWCYNWGQISDGLTSDCAYVPMLWGNKDTFFSSWSTNAQAAIDAGSTHLLSFNEPDNPAQANMGAADAATYHQTYMNPFSGKAKIASPAVTNSNTAGESLDWLQSWIDACDGQCVFDACAVHWYNTIEAGADDLFEFVTKASETCGSDKTIWITEFAPNVDNPSADKISSFLTTVQDAFDNDSTYDFVEAYAYFYVDDGLVDGTTLSTYGNTFAFS